MTEFEDRLRDGLRAEGSRVKPPERLTAIRGRTTDRSSVRRTWWVPALSGVAALGLVAGAVVLVTGLPDDRGGTTQAAGSSQSPGTEPTTSTTSSAARQVTVWVLRTEANGTRQDLSRYVGTSLYPVTRIVDPVPGDKPGVDAVEALLAYDLSADGDDALNIWHEGLGPDQPLDLDVRSVDHQNGVVTVDFAGAVDDPWPTTEVSWAVDPALFSQQLVRTVQDALDTTDPVLVTQDGQPVDAVLTAPVQQPIQADDADLAHVYLTAPSDDATVVGPLTVTGESNTFEGTVNWRVLQEGEVVGEDYAMGGSYGEWKPFRFTVDLPPGSYTIEVFETSAEDGTRQYVTTIHVTVE